MHVGLVGISYKSSELQEREAFAKASKSLEELKLKAFFDLSLVLVSTCNRTEIYFTAPDLAEAHSLLLMELKKEASFLDHTLYSYFGEKCFNHLAEVTAGLDSVILGEAEIQRQVKEAYEEKAKKEKLPASLHFLFQKSLKIGKEIRTDFSLPSGSVSVESTSLDLIRYFFRDEKNISLLFVGYSEINRKILTFLKGKGFSNLYLATKNPESAKEFTDSFSIHQVSWLNLENWSAFDGVICGSKTSQFLLKPDQLHKKEALKNRLIIDLGVPRNVDPQVAKHPSILLFNIEEVDSFIHLKQKRLLQKSERIRESIEQKVSKQVELYHCKTSHQTLCVS